MDDISPEMADAAARHIKGATIAWGAGQCYDFDQPNPEIITIEDAAAAKAYRAAFWALADQIDHRQARAI